jgi:SAM-dependent methyltransferase
MLRIATQTHAGSSVSFRLADVRRLPDLGTFDVAVSSGEPLNHLRNEQELGLAFEQISRALADNGLAVLDLLGRPAYERLLKRGSLVDERADGMRVLRWTPLHPGSLSVRTTVDRFTAAGGGAWRHSVSYLDEVFFDTETVRRAAIRAGLTAVKFYGLLAGKLDGEFDPARHARHLVVARNHR